MPIAVLLLACLYIAVGAIGFVAHFSGLIALQTDSIWIETTELLALVAGVFMLRRHNWARWLALVWMAFHVAISFPARPQLLIHSVIFALIAWGLLRPESTRYFRSPKQRASTT